MQIRFGAIQNLGTHKDKGAPNTQYIDLKFDGPDLDTYAKLLGHNPVVGQTNDVLRIAYRKKQDIYGKSTHSTPHTGKALAAARELKQTLLNDIASMAEELVKLVREKAPSSRKATALERHAAKLREQKPPSSEPFSYDKELHYFTVSKRGVRTLFQKLLQQLDRDKVLKRPLLQGIQETFTAIKNA